MRRVGAVVEHHDSHFALDEKDEVWLRKVGKNGWIVITKDKMIRRRRIEFDAIISAKVKAFILTSGNLRGDEIEAVITNNLGKIFKIAEEFQAPFIAAVRRTDVKILFPRK